ncbi:MAG: hypothetical protein DRJ45_07930 [Thermoprotei archaeon]|nr:MAG: hypothetical protein DRJ45_07930 [Thermoprotei archaeon]
MRGQKIRGEKRKNGKRKEKKIAVVFALLLALAFVSIDTVCTSVICVLNNYASIQLTADNTGGMVIVKDGTYNEYKENVNKRLTIQSENKSAPTIVQAADSIVSIGNISVAPNTTVTESVMIYNAKDIASAQFKLSYDPSVCQVIDVTNGDFEMSSANLEHKSEGYINVAAINSEGLNGNVTIVNIKFVAVGNQGDKSYLNLSETELYDFNTSKVDHIVNNGIFIITTLNFDTGSPENPYPSAFGVHTGTITPNKTLIISKLYTYPCPGTGGHTKFIELYENGILIANGTWNGYENDWHNITIHNVSGAPYVMLLKGHEYSYTIHTGSYPQIHHTNALQTANGWINCTQFIDANGRTYNDWIPAIILFAENFYSPLITLEQGAIP